MMLVSLIAVRSGSNALYVLMATLISMLVVSSIISRHALKQLSLTLRTPDRIFAGDRVPTRVSVTNLKRLFPSLAIAVEENSPNTRIDPAHDCRMAYFPILRAGETRSERLVQIFPRRGYCRQALRVSTRFPFGFFNRRDSLPSQKLLIYPALGEIPELFRSQDIFSGHMESRERGDSDGFYSIRDYRDGESVRIIDWKATAKTRRLMAREFARESEIRCLLFLDTFVPSLKNLENDEPFEKAVSLAAGLAAHFLRKGALVELLTQEEHIPAGIGERHLYRILEALAVTRQQMTLDLFDRESGCGGGDNDSATRLPKEIPLPDVRRILSARSFKIILTTQHPESFPIQLRRAAHIIPFEPADPFYEDGRQDAAVKQA